LLSASKIRVIGGKNMQLKEKQIKEFQTLYKKNFGKKISKQKAIVDGMALIRLVYLTQPSYGVKK
jgi:hypothetical protein